MLSIGPIPIKHPFTLAALSGFSDLPMRRIARDLGAAYAVNQVVLDSSVTHGSRWQDRLLTVEKDDHPVGAQIMGDAPAKCAEAARLLAAAGYDIIDINFGCPAPKILNRGHGGCLLGRPTTAIEIIHRVIEAVNGVKPVAIKLRKGIDDSVQSERCVFSLIDGALELGASAFVIHGRTVTQRYTGTSDWDFLARVKRHVGNTTVIGSGDLFTARDCLDMISRTGVDGVALARGALGNPWVFRDCLALQAGNALPPPPTLAEQRQVIRRHYEELTSCFDPDLAGRVMPKHVLKYSRFHPTPKRVRIAFVGIRTPSAFETAFNEWYPPNVQ